MDTKIKEKFIGLWQQYFNEQQLPITLYYTDKPEPAEPIGPAGRHRCIICDLPKALKGESLCFDVDSIGCGGGKRYLGFTDQIMPNFEYFLSCGIAGKLEGERYKKSPELVRQTMEKAPSFKAPARFIVFKRWDMLTEADQPAVVIFFVRPDVLSGLFTLANFDHAEPNGVFSPFTAGCGSIVQYPYLEKSADQPRAVVGLFDISARPYIDQDVLSFSVPINKFVHMIDNMEESFLITASWSKVKKRIGRARTNGS